MIITDTAKSFIEKAMKENDLYTLRFTFEGAGCCGPNYGVTLEKADQEDIVEMINGLEVAMDPKVEETVRQLTLDLQEDEHGVGLIISGGTSCC